MTPPNNLLMPGPATFAPRHQAAVCPSTCKPSSSQTKTCSVRPSSISMNIVPGPHLPAWGASNPPLCDSPRLKTHRR